MHGEAKLNCHIFALSLRMSSNAPTAFMPATARPHCILWLMDFKDLAFVFGLCRWVGLLFITAVPNTKLCAWAEEDSGGRVL